ncbi:hypothetical protein DYB30_004646 [Aphanomyces astaci]|uniref:EF-hand domain-containing protein n=2 Tax=Aphanomyces astaci TaxID=112090 RepID=A0A397C9X1_APHAT|nr:hypothetical protein DYB30_004646 [Aphanomyces astaci]RHZ35015.1 hypothetical protein DYB26_012416 [Aphanomyces astaci]
MQQQIGDRSLLRIMSLAVETARHLAAGRWTEKNSLFRVGDNISEWLVMLLMFLVVVGVILFEQVWHWLGHKLHPYPKYHEMMHKITSELMILGMLGLFVHLFSEAYWIDFYSKPVKAFKIADQTIFFVACFLIAQAVLIFYVMRQKNIMTDQIELVSSHYIYRKAKAALDKANYANWFQYEAKKRRALRVMRHKILRRFFLRTYNLPEMFQFSWYLRMQQDSQIQHLIDIELTQWLLLLLVWCGFIAAHNSVERSLVVHDDDEQPKYIRVYVFMAFEFALSIVMGLMWLYIRQCMNTVYKYLGIYNNKDVLAKMRECAEEERHTRESQADSIAHLERLHYNMDMRAHGHRFFLAGDQGVQLLSLAVRKCFRHEAKSASHVQLAHGGESPRIHHPRHGGSQAKTLSELTSIKLPLFSRKLLHYFLKTFLMLNGLFAAIAMNSVVYILPDVPDMDYTVLVVLMAIPLLLNAFYVGPRLMLQFMTLSTLWQLNADNVSLMVSQYLSTIEKKTHLVDSIRAFLDKTHQTVDDLRCDLERNGGTRDYIDMETFRVVLAHYGCHVSLFKFNAMIRLVFKTKGAMVNYEQLMGLVAGEVDVCIDQTVDMMDNLDDFDFTLDEHDKKAKVLGSVAVDIGARQPLQPIGIVATYDEDFATPAADGDLIHDAYSEQR